jgi:hypothetical protein
MIVEFFVVFIPGVIDGGYYHFPGVLPVEFAFVIQLGQVEFDTDESSIKIIPIDDISF